MKLYTTGQGHWAGTQADARKVKKDQGLFCVLYDVPVSKQELLTFLNTNRVTTEEEETRSTPASVAPKPSVVPKRTIVEDAPSGSEQFIGKTTMLVGGGMSQKIHTYFYTENITGITTENDYE